MSRSSADKRDVYYRLCKSSGYRARSAFKLLHLDEQYDLFRGVETACDLCAAPGSWSQVLSRKLSRTKTGQLPKIISIDLQPMAPLPNTTILCGDITLPQTVERMLEVMEGRKADLVVCDGAPEITGVHDLDAYLHSQLLLAAFTLSIPLLSPSSTLIFKFFTSPTDPHGDSLVSSLRGFFESPPPCSLHNTHGGGMELPGADEGMCTVKGYDKFGRRGGVWVSKPRSSRAGSAEAFLICRNFKPLSGGALDLTRLDMTKTLSLDSFDVGVGDGVGVGGGGDGEREEERKRWEIIKKFTIGDLDV